ncbi:hypothetical protein GLW08_16480 [Pontibacillus yanchengensis]|uniref:Uncharacterized protein n=1 Tax=Pontibacillus yanchengensis TaxID=462910 RepID=A0ACC7VJI4_9BACI|nr:hypothetical protein [Pontibacillus yanchengensis]MYL54932.1 hypothetical protein [Pontibacillus yanchengensis]
MVSVLKRFGVVLSCIILLTACSEAEETDAKTIMATGKVVEKNTEDTERYIEVLTIVENNKRNIKLQVKNENVWNLILKDKFYRVSFDIENGTYSPLKEIKTIKVDPEKFQKDLMNLN